jgi:anti-sigma-K factor RskA
MSERSDEHALRESFARLEGDLPRVAPREDLFGAIRAQIEPAAMPAAPRSRPARWRRPRLVVALAGATVAAAAALTAVVVLDTDDGATTVTAALVAHREAGVSGRVELRSPDSDHGRVGLEVRDLERAPAGFHYTVWVLRVDSEQMTPIGSFTVPGGELDLPLPGPARYAALDISLQRNEAPPAHSGVSVAGATFV